MKDKTIDLDRLMAAPVVVRGREMGSAQFWMDAMGADEYRQMMREMHESPLSVGNLLKDAVERRQMSGVANSYRLVAQRVSNVLGGATPANLMVCATLEEGVAYFQTTDALEERLNATDISAEIPSRFLRAPYDFCWIEFGETRSSPLAVFNRESGAHIAEGVIVRQRTSGSDGQGTRRVLDLVFVGSPKGKRWPMDDALQLFTLVMEDAKGETVGTLIAAARQRCATHPGLNGADITIANAMWDQSIPLIEHLCKVLLYLNLGDARKRAVNERSQLLAEATRRGRKKLGKIARRSSLAYDRVVIGPNARSHGGSTVASGRRSVETHTRRGHFRWQPFGPGREQRRLLWIEPTLVAAHHLADDDDPVTPKPYVAR